MSLQMIIATTIDYAKLAIKAGSIFAFIALHFASNAESSVVEYAPIVQLKNGQVRGIVHEADLGLNVQLYQGIRYGRAQRFAKPKPVEPWSGVYDATTYRDACVQFGFAGRIGYLQNYTQTESDDCLFLNVWKPQIEGANRSVMVFFHGGSFETGTIFTPLFDGRYMAGQGDVVLVSVNYRLGPFGFLYANTEDAPGNAGLHDQILALKWVQENIEKFGGDPNRVTIFGESAGSISVGALIISPLTKGLFKRAIMQSGSPLIKATLDSTTSALEKTQMFAKKLNCSSTPIEETLKCLRALPHKLVVKATVGEFLRKELFALIYGDELLPIEPVRALKSGAFNQDIDLLYGVNSGEGSGFLTAVIPQMKSFEFNLTVADLKQDIILVMSMVDKQNWTEVADYYISKLPHQPTQDDLKATFANVFGDYNMVCPTILFGEQIAARSSPSNNFYSYRLVQNVQIYKNPAPAWMGVIHGTDIYYLFVNEKIKQHEDAVRLGRDMIRAWTNFAKLGHPGKMGSIEWTPSISNSTNAEPATEHLNLDLTNYKMVKKYFSDTCNAFWKAKIFA